MLARDGAALHRALAAREAALASVALLQPAELSALRTPPYRTHVALAERLGVPPTATQAALRTGTSAPGLVLLATNDAYWITPARYSVARATPDAAAALDSIGAAFGARLARRTLPRFAFVVTSVLRSGEDQEELRRVNPNAAAGRSSHEYGVSFDIAYRRYVPAMDTALARPLPSVPPVLRGWARARRMDRIAAHNEHLAEAYPSRLDALLGRSLLALKADSVLVVLRERRQPVYHVTVARRLMPGAAPRVP